MSELPTKEEITKLPRWAIVAFAARVARRLLPLSTYEGLGRDGIEEAVTSVEFAAANQKLYEAFELLEVKERPSDLLRDFGADIAEEVASIATRIANEVDAATRGELIPLQTDWETQRIRQRLFVRLESLVSGLLTGVERLAHHIDVRPHVRLDFECLLRQVKKARWPEEMLFEAEIFGAFWPDGAPDGWPEGAVLPSQRESEEVEGAPPLKLYFDINAVSAREISEMIGLLSDLYRSVGGDKLVIDHQLREVEIEIPEGVEV